MTTSLQALYKRRTFGVKLGLDVQRALMAQLGHPEQAFAAIHVAGTNGKGSVCAMLEGILLAMGFRVGLYTSPHLVRFNERIRINGVDIDDELLAAVLETTDTAARAVVDAGLQEPTFFECATAMAFEAFRRANIQIAIIETGLGGRLDATNVLTPLMACICRLSLEHTAYLGNDLESIAREKGGIIKPGRPVVVGQNDAESRQVLISIAKACDAPLVDAAEHVSARVVSADYSGQKVSVETANASYGTVWLPLPGAHQLENLAVAVAAAELLEGLGLPALTPAMVKQGLAATRWQGRGQVLSETPLTIVDGAHNPGAAAALAAMLKRTAGKRPVALVCGFCNDKDVRAFLKALTGVARELWIVPVSNERNIDVSLVKEAAMGLGLAIHNGSLTESIAEAQTWACALGGVVCITGSLFVVGDALALEMD